MSTPNEKLKAQQIAEPIIPESPLSNQSELDKIAAATELARKEKERLEAVYALEATKLHYPDVESWQKAQAEFLVLQEQTNKDKARLDAESIKLKAGQDELSAKISETNTDIDTAHDDLNKYIADAKQRLDSTLKEFDNGSKGLLEQVAWLLTTPPIKAAESVTFPRCADCLKQDDANRDMTFAIPRLKITPCAECEQKRSRQFPVTVCDLCPTVSRLREAARLVLQALVSSGVMPTFDTDGVYQKTIEADKNRILKASDRVRIILKEHGFET